MVRTRPRIVLAGLIISLFWLGQSFAVWLNFEGWGFRPYPMEPKQLMGADWVFIAAAAAILLAGLVWSRIHWSMAEASPGREPQVRWILLDETAKFSMAVVVSMVCFGIMTVAFQHLDQVSPLPGRIRLNGGCGF